MAKQTTKKNRMAKENKEFAELFDVVKDSITKLGTRGTSNALKTAQSAKDNNAIMINFIVEKVVLEFGGVFSKTDFFKPNIRGEAIIGRNMIFVLISKSLPLIPREIGNYLQGCSSKTIRLVICDYHKLEKTNSFDKKIIERHERIFMEIANRAKKNK